MQTDTGRHRLGHKWVCFECQSKFYDLNKPDPRCPRCGADPRAAPALEPRTLKSKKRAKRKGKSPSVPDDALERSAPAVVKDSDNLGLGGVASETDEIDGEVDEEFTAELDLELGDEPAELEDDETAA